VRKKTQQEGGVRNSVFSQSEGGPLKEENEAFVIKKIAKRKKEKQRKNYETPKREGESVRDS